MCVGGYSRRVASLAPSRWRSLRSGSCRITTRGGLPQPWTEDGRSSAFCFCLSPSAAAPLTWTWSSRPCSPDRSAATSASRWTSSSQDSRGKRRRRPSQQRPSPVLPQQPTRLVSVSSGGKGLLGDKPANPRFSLLALC